MFRVRLKILAFLAPSFIDSGIPIPDFKDCGFSCFKDSRSRFKSFCVPRSRFPGPFLVLEIQYSSHTENEG